MSNSTTLLYDVIDTDMHTAYVPSKLYGLKSVTTGHVESLTSYINRIACEHHVIPRKLIEYEYFPYLEEKFDKNISHFCNTSSRRINGSSHYAEQFIQITQELTGKQNLLKNTMLIWKDMVFKGPNGFNRSSLSWCPHCFQEMKDKGNVIYEYLSWTMNATTHCDVHYKPLSDKCPHCGKEQPIFSNTRVGYCHHCYEWLGKEFDGEFHNMNGNEYSQFRLSCAASNMANMADELQLPPSKELFVQQLQHYVDTLSDGDVPKFSREIIKTAYTNTYRWLRAEQVPKFDMFLYICANLGLDPVGFFNQQTPNPEPIGAKLVVDKTSDQRIEKIMTHLNEILSDTLESISLEEVAKSLKVTAEYLEHCFPSEANEIRYRHSRKLMADEEKRFSKYHKTAKNIENVVRNLVDLAYMPTKLRVNMALKHKLDFKDDTVEQLYRDIVAKYTKKSKK